MPDAIKLSGFKVNSYTFPKEILTLSKARRFDDRLSLSDWIAKKRQPNPLRLYN